MSDEQNIRRVKQGHQPSRDELKRGYQVTQPVDMSHLKPPSNMGDAAVTPANSPSPTPAPARPAKP